MPIPSRDARRYAGPRFLAALLLLAGCQHGEPLTADVDSSESPREPGIPTQLTYSLGDDQYPAWLADGSGLLYSFLDGGSLIRRDRCLGLLPPGGGQIEESRCPTNDLQDDSTDVLLQPAPRSDGKVAWLELHSAGSRVIWDYGELKLGDLRQDHPGTTLLTLPYVASSGNVHATLLDLRWLSSTQLAYIGADVVVRAPCQNCKADTLVVAKEVMLLNTTGGAPVPLANSAETTSIWPTPDSLGLFYTLAGDTRVFRRTLAGGAQEVVHDFGLLGIARDVSVVGNRLSAVVGGKVSYGFELVTGFRQVDSGGVVMTVNLTSNAEQVYPARDSAFYRRGVLSPDGTTLVVEGVTPPSPNPNLWLYQVQ